MIYLALFTVIAIIIGMAIQSWASAPPTESTAKMEPDIIKINPAPETLGPVACGLLESLKNEPEKWKSLLHYHALNNAEYRILNHDNGTTVNAYKPHTIYGINYDYSIRTNTLERFSDYEHITISKFIWENPAFETEEEKKRRIEKQEMKKRAEYFAKMCPNNKE